MSKTAFLVSYPPFNVPTRQRKSNEKTIDSEGSSVYRGQKEDNTHLTPDIPFCNKYKACFYLCFALEETLFQNKPKKLEKHKKALDSGACAK